MYESYFGLTERPFSIAPDPHYLYMSSRHKEAMAHLSYGLSQGGCFIVLTGEVGTGKTTLCRNLLNDQPENVDVALILNANLNEAELLQTVCDELKVAYTDNLSQKQLLDLINNHLLKTFSENRHTVLIIDEAQLLKRDVLEQVRLLTNLETTKSKLLQIILIGQPELYGLLSRNDLRQLAQRVTARYHLGALQRNEIEEYVNYRLGVAGCKQPLFSRQALNKMHDLTGGIPRKINVLADHALLSTYSQNKRLVESKNVVKAAKEVFIVTKTEASFFERYAKWAAAVVLIILLNVFAWFHFSGDKGAASVELVSKDQSGSIDSLVTSVESEVIDSDVDESLKVEGDKAPKLAAASGLVEPSLDTQVVDVQVDDVQVVGESVATSAEPSDSITGDQKITPGTAVVSENYLSVDPEIDTVVTSSVKLSSGDSVAKPQVVHFSENTEFGQVLDVSGDLTGRITAFRALSRLWNVELPNQILKPVCQASSEQGLSCLSLKSWDDLASFNRPAILVVEHKGRAHRVIVQSIDEGVADVSIGQASQQVPLSELRERWTGAGVIFWRSGGAASSYWKLGDNTPSVVVVRAKLNAALNQAKLPALVDAHSLKFDQDMHQKTIAIQQTFGLIGDGQIGNETHLLVNELASSDSTPVLVKRIGALSL